MENIIYNELLCRDFSVDVGVVTVSGFSENKSSMKSWTDDDGIQHLGLYEFLLNENSLEL